MTSKSEIREWLYAAKNDGMYGCCLGKGATHVIVAYDSFDHDDYPVFVMPGDDVQREVNRIQIPGNMQHVVEVYAMHLDIEKQLNEKLAWHVESAPWDAKKQPYPYMKWRKND